MPRRSLRVRPIGTAIATPSSHAHGMDAQSTAISTATMAGARSPSAPVTAAVCQRRTAIPSSGKAIASADMSSDP